MAELQPTLYQNYIALSRYARFRPDLGRREVWGESVDRLIDFWRGRLSDYVDDETFAKVREFIVTNKVMPSMRSLMTAGEALTRDEVAGYNCAYTACEGVGPEIALWDSKLQDMGFDEPITIALRTPIAFDCALYVLLCGTGLGFSVERQFINTLPTIGKPLSRSIYKPTDVNFPRVPVGEISTIDDNTIRVMDSKYGWASALRILLVELYNGNFSVQYDMSRIRPAGTVLKTFGGRASGPEPLKNAFDFAIELFKQADGRKLNSIECHDLMCKVADAVVSGGVRRAALISLSNLSDDRMRHAKSGEWWNTDPQRMLANNSVCYTEKPNIGTFMREWESLYMSRSGERGIFNREAARKLCEKIGRDPNHEFGCNPCSEILLRSGQFCNLTEIVVRPDDTLDTLKEKAEIASILGTWQATLTNFAYLPPIWKQNCDEERLLGVSLTGLMDHPLLSEVSPESRKALSTLRDHVKVVNKTWAKRLGINPAAATTCVKPSGTVSQLVDSASGLHPRYAPYYIRRVRSSVKDPLTQTMLEAGFPCEPDVMSSANMVFSFPMKAPEGAVMRDDRSAIDQLEHWLMIQVDWCEHKPSITVYVRENEWLEVGAWVYKHFDLVSGVSFLPHSDHSYMQAPYEEISQETYETLVAKMPEALPLDILARIEKGDMTTGTREFACAGGACEIV